MAIEVIAHLGKTKDGCDVLITTDKLEPYRLVRGYDPNEEPGQQWSHTVIACDEIGFFAELIVNHNKPISYWKTCEIAEKAINYLFDEDMLEDMLEDQDLELDEEDREYFGVKVYEDDEED